MPRIDQFQLDGGRNSFQHPADIAENQQAYLMNFENNDKGAGIKRRDGSVTYRDLKGAGTPFVLTGNKWVQYFDRWISRIGERLLAVMDGQLADVTDPDPTNWVMIRNDLDPTAVMSGIQFQDKYVLGNGKRCPIKVEYNEGTIGKLFGQDDIKFGVSIPIMSLDVFSSPNYIVSVTKLAATDSLQNGGYINTAIDRKEIFVPTLTGVSSTKRIDVYDTTLILKRSIFQDIGAATPIMLDVWSETSDLYVASTVQLERRSRNTGTILASAIMQVKAGDSGVTFDVHADSDFVYIVRGYSEAFNQGIWVAKYNATTLAFVSDVRLRNIANPVVETAYAASGAGPFNFPRITASLSTLFVAYRYQPDGVVTYHSLTKALGGVTTTAQAFTECFGIAYDGTNVLVAQLANIKVFNRTTNALIATRTTPTPLMGLATIRRNYSAGIISGDVTGLEQPYCEDVIGAASFPAATYEVFCTVTGLGQALGEFGVSPASTQLTLAVASDIVVGLPIAFAGVIGVNTEKFGVVDKRTIYIRNVTTGAFVHSQDVLDNTTTIVTCVKNSRGISPPSITPQVLSGNIFAVHEGRLAISGDSINTSIVQMLEAATLDYSSENSIASITGNTDKNSAVTAMIVSNQRTWIMSHDTIGYVQDDGERSFIIQSVTRTRGSIANAVVELNGPFRMLSNDGVYEDVGDKRLSVVIDDVWRGLFGEVGIDMTRREQFKAARDPFKNQSWFAVTSNGFVNNDMMIVYDSYKGAMYIFRFVQFRTIHLTTMKDDADLLRIFGGTDDGRIILFNEGRGDDDIPIAARFRTGIIQKPTYVEKKIKTIWWDVEGHAINAPESSAVYRYLVRRYEGKAMEHIDEIDRHGDDIGMYSIKTLIAQNSNELRSRQAVRHNVRPGGQTLGVMAEVILRNQKVDDQPLRVYGYTVEIEGTEAV